MNTDALLHWLLRTSIEASVLILAVLGLRLMLGARLSPAWRIGLWMLVGMKLMLPAFIPAGFGLGALMNQETATVSDVIQASSPSEQTSILKLSTGSLPEGPPQTSWSFSPQILLLGGWLVGAAFTLLIAFRRQRRFETLLRRYRPATSPHLLSLVARLSSRAGIRQSVSILLMPAGTTPAMVGVRRPKLLLPEDWECCFDDRSLRHVVLHELLHVKQRDLLWNWAAIAVQALHWFNPLVWFVVSRFQADRELRCDAGALALLSPAERLDYGHTLLRIQETFFAPPAIAGLAPCVRNHPTLRQRILMITHPTTRQPWLHALLVLTLSILVGYSFTTTRAAEKEVPPKVREGETVKKPVDTVPLTTDSNERVIRKLLPQGTELTHTTFQQNLIEVKGLAQRLDQVVALKDSLIESSELKNWIWEIPHLASRPDGKLVFFMSARPANHADEGTRSSDTNEGLKKPGSRDGDGDGGTKKPSMRDGEGGVKKPGAGDGEKPRSDMKDGEKPRAGERDGEKPRTEERDGTKKTGERESDVKKPGASDGDKATSSGEVITLKVIKNGDAVMVGDEEISMDRLRGHLSTFLPNHPGANVQVTASGDIPLRAVYNTIDAVRDNGNKNVGIKAE